MKQWKCSQCFACLCVLYLSCDQRLLLRTQPENCHKTFVLWTYPENVYMFSINKGNIVTSILCVCSVLCVCVILMFKLHISHWWWWMNIVEYRYIWFKVRFKIRSGGWTALKLNNLSVLWINCLTISDSNLYELSSKSGCTWHFAEIRNIKFPLQL